MIVDEQLFLSPMSRLDVLPHDAPRRALVMLTQLPRFHEHVAPLPLPVPEPDPLPLPEPLPEPLEVPEDEQYEDEGAHACVPSESVPQHVPGQSALDAQRFRHVGVCVVVGSTRQSTPDLVAP